MKVIGTQNRNHRFHTNREYANMKDGFTVQSLSTMQ